MRIADRRIILMENAFCARFGIQEAPAIYESRAVVSPLTIGFWNPVIVIPKGMLNALFKDERNDLIYSFTVKVIKICQGY